MIAEDDIVGDSQSDGPPAPDYRDWIAKDTRIITYGIGRGNNHDAHWANTLSLAREEVAKLFGRILEETAFKTRAFFRVFKSGVKK